MVAYFITEGITQQPEQAKYRRLIQALDRVELSHLREQMKKTK